MPDPHLQLLWGPLPQQRQLQGGGPRVRVRVPPWLLGDVLRTGTERVPVGAVQEWRHLHGRPWHLPVLLRARFPGQQLRDRHQRMCLAALREQRHLREREGPL